MQRKRIAKKWLCGLLTGWLLMTGAPVPGETAAVANSFDSRIYWSRLDKYDTMRVYHVEGEDYVPYVSVQRYLPFLYGKDISFHLDGERNLLTAERNGISMEFDADEGIIRCGDWDAFFGSYGEKALPNGILHPSEFNAQAVSRKHPSTETEATGFDINLSSYGLKMTVHEGQMLVSLQPCRISSLCHGGQMSFPSTAITFMTSSGPLGLFMDMT